MSTTTNRLPTYFISHGGGPWPWIKDQMPFDMEPLERSLQAIPREIGVAPTAVLVISAHWEAPQFTVQTNPNPPMLYDYGGFPEFTYHIQYPAPGSPQVAARVTELLDAAGIANAQDASRGFDHGMFAPMYAAWPDADVPMLQLSVTHGYDPDAHLATGRALAPLRDEGVLIVGSGLSFHNLRLFGPAAAKPSSEFDSWLDDALTASAPNRTEALRRWEQAPSARIVHPAEDHLIPLMVAVGAAEDEPASRTYHQTDFGGATASSYRFGAAS
ncbi:MAG TPA: class III extradiol ring-cleavage dioxygenase [Microthrixaceae bacterium]|jgi:aromatic ring-opening dioxygenase catalytic subunit (LigB family)|nr:class III extradiol ring-cleavage dioxygenase [Microthrixaceae bacterium]